MKKIILCFLMCSIFNIEVNASMSETGEIIMSENQSLNLISEITRIGSTEKWNSSLFFEGSLKIHVLKDGTITDYGMYTLSKTKFGFPVAIRVSNLNDKNKHFNFFVSTPSGLLFKNPIYVNIKDLFGKNIFFIKTELLQKDNILYKDVYSPEYIFKHTFKYDGNRKIIYEFYSALLHK